MYSVLIKSKCLIVFDRTWVSALSIMTLNSGFGVRKWMRWCQEHCIFFQTQQIKCNLNIGNVHSVTTTPMKILLFYSTWIYRERGTEGNSSLHFPSPDTNLSTAVQFVPWLHLHRQIHTLCLLICTVVTAVLI